MTKSYLTRKEHMRVQAYKNNDPRPLNKTEQVLLHLLNIAQSDRSSAKDLEVKVIIQALKDLGARDALISKVEQAANDLTFLDELLEVYPHVKYNNVIGTQVNMNAVEKAHVATYYPPQFDNVQSAASWIIKAHLLAKYLLEYIPAGTETYIATRDTDYDVLRRLAFVADIAADEQIINKPYLGYILPKQLQAEVHLVFSHHCFGGHKADLLALINHDIHSYPNLFGRVGLKEVFEKAQVPGLEIIYPTDHSTQMLGRRVVTFNHKDTNTVLYFQI